MSCMTGRATCEGSGATGAIFDWYGIGPVLIGASPWLSGAMGCGVWPMDLPATLPSFFPPDHTHNPGLLTLNAPRLPYDNDFV